MMLLTNDIPTSINQKKEAVPILGPHRTFNWFENLPKVCQELLRMRYRFDKRKSISGKMGQYPISYSYSTKLYHYSEGQQFFTPSDVALYAAFSLLDNYNMEIIFDPCKRGMEAYLLQLHLYSKNNCLAGIIKKLHGSEILE